MGKTDKEEDPDMISKDPAERKKQDEAAVRIQANWKGKQDREKVKQKKIKKEQDQAATKI